MLSVEGLDPQLWGVIHHLSCAVHANWLQKRHVGRAQPHPRTSCDLQHLPGMKLAVDPIPAPCPGCVATTGRPGPPQSQVWMTEVQKLCLKWCTIVELPAHISSIWWWPWVFRNYLFKSIAFDLVAHKSFLTIIFWLPHEHHHSAT